VERTGQRRRESFLRALLSSALLLFNGSLSQSIGSGISSSNSKGTSKVSSGSDSRGAHLAGISLSDPPPFSSTLSGTGSSRFRDEPVVSISMAAIGLGFGSSGALHLREDYRQIGPLIKLIRASLRGHEEGPKEGPALVVRVRTLLIWGSSFINS
jgi:hypothetical protein